MIAETFIRRPILASVCSLVIILAGAIAIPTLPIAQFPELAPPQVSVVAFYNGANAETVETAVTIPLEQAINGVEGMQYMTSTSGNDGTSNITVTFDLSRSLDLAAVDVQNRISQAEGRLPNEVKQIGLSVTKVSNNFVLAAAAYAEHGEYDPLFISNYVDRFVVDEIKRVPGVGNAIVFGIGRYAMRLWIDPDKLAGRNITADEVVGALREQNVQVAAGAVGGDPAPKGQTFQISVRAAGRLNDPAQFADIILKRSSDGSLVRVRDVGRTELGAESYTTASRFNARDAVGIGVLQLPTANSLQVFRDVKAELDRLSKRFPPGLKVSVAFETTSVVSESIREVVTTLTEAIGLVVLVMFLFLQNWRTTLIPAITIPVSLIGTFALVKLFGFSINTLTLFGITLATGLVVDDAIVVIENIERHIHDRHLANADHDAPVDTHEASSDAMREVTSAVIATALVLAAVFVPVAFFPGTTGRLYQQFAMTIAVSMAISAFNALTLTPALSALLLSGTDKPKGAFFRVVNRVIDGGTNFMVASLRTLIRVRAIVVIVFVLLLGATYWTVKRVPTGFVPDEDQGYVMVLVQAPPGASLDYTMGIIKQAEQVMLKNPDLLGMFAAGGFGFTGTAPNQGILFAQLKDFKDRPGEERSAKAVVGQLFGAFSQITGGMVIPFLPPAINGLGIFGGFEYQLLDQSGGAIGNLEATAQQLIAQGNQTPGLTALFTQFTANDPQIVVNIDREQAKSLGMSLGDITNTMQVLLGSAYVNDFDFNGRSYRVYVQADQQFRSNPSDIEKYNVRTAAGRMAPLSNIVSVTEATAPKSISHFNLFRAATINGSAAPGYSSGQALQIMGQLSDRALPQGFSYAWSGVSLEEIRAGSQSVAIFGLGLLLVYLTLAGQYESLTLPFIILLSVPLAIMGALLAQWSRGLIDDVYCQIGLVMLIGLSAKNGILIVEFAEQLRARGMSIAEAAVEAARIRLRPILMTSLAFILGVMPLVVASGAGREARHSVGTAVAGGMIASTFLNLAFIPVLYVVVKSITERRRRVPRAACWVLGAGIGCGALGAVPGVGCGVLGARVAAQALTLPTPVIRVSFTDAIQRAQEKNPTVAAAAASILRAEGLIRQARAASQFQVFANVTSTTLNRGVEFDGATVTPRSQLTATLTADVPIFAAAAWARRAQAEDTKAIAELDVADVKRQIAFATADAYLAILASRRVVESNTLARDTAKAHFDLATELEQGGTGSRLNALRAQQQFSVDSGLVEVAQLSLYRAQEALGVLIVADGPADATDEPDFAAQAAPSVAAFSTTNLIRTDLKLLSSQQLAAERIVRDTAKEWYPTVDAIFQPSTTYPAQFFLPQHSWRFLLQANIPIFDSGLRSSERIQRQADVEQFTASLSRALLDANAEVRAARQAVASGERTLALARTALDQAQQVVNITNISFRAGAATNIEVIDAERVARDNGLAVAIAEDQLRRARLELLNALGRFP